jgi:hypothetical protein
MADFAGETPENRLTRQLTRYESWDRLVGLWAGVVEEVERGYELTLDDYHNDLDLRSLVQDVLDGLQADRSEQVLDQIRGLDARFLAATREVSDVIATRDRGPWARRLPLRPAGELKEDIEAEGL